jgi:aerobic C4-dicarboxylate transport protein
VAGQRFYKTLYGQVLIATVAGVLVGHFWPAAGVAMKPLGDGFIKLVRMIIAPVIFCTVVAGIAGAAGTKAVGKAGGLALVYFEAVTTLALVLGLVIVNVVRPGAGMNVNPATLDATAVAQYVSAGKAQSATAFLLDIIPTSVVDAFAKGDILQVLLFSLLFGLALRRLRATAAPLVEIVDKVSGVLFAIVGIIMTAGTTDRTTGGRQTGGCSRGGFRKCRAGPVSGNLFREVVLRPFDKLRVVPSIVEGRQAQCERGVEGDG